MHSLSLYFSFYKKVSIDILPTLLLGAIYSSNIIFNFPPLKAPSFEECFINIHKSYRASVLQ